MDKIGHRAVIQYLHIKGLTPKEIHEDMVAIQEDNALSYIMVKKWKVDFKRGRDSLEDGPRLPLSVGDLFVQRQFVQRHFVHIFFCPKTPISKKKSLVRES